MLDSGNVHPYARKVGSRASRPLRGRSGRSAPCGAGCLCKPVVPTVRSKLGPRGDCWQVMALRPGAHPLIGAQAVTRAAEVGEIRRGKLGAPAS